MPVNHTAKSELSQRDLHDDFEDLLGTPTVVLLPATNEGVALELAQRGFVVFPIRQWREEGGWKPIKDWQSEATKEPAKIRAWWKKWPDARVGLPTGARNGLTVLDVDVKNGKDGTHTLKKMGFSDLSTITPFRARTPSGGWHLLFEHTPSFKNWVGKIGEGLDVRTNGGYIIAPYSLKDNMRYEVQGDPIFRDSKFPAIPAAIMSRAPLRDDDEEDLLGTLVTIQKASPWQMEWAAEKLEAQAEIVANAPDGQRQATLNNAVFLCAGLAVHGALTEEQVRAALVPAGEACGLPRQEVSTTFKHAWAGGLKKPVPLPPDCEDEFEDYGDEEVGLPIPAKSRGIGKAMRTESGKLIVNATNAIIVLGKEVDSILPGLRRNLMTGTDEWSGGLVDDAAIMTTRVHLEQRGLPTIGKELVSDAITTVARAREAHPIRDWLKGLKHDGKPRLEAWLSRYLGAEDTPYSRGIGKAFLLSMVARVMQPGCKVDHALVLAGPQGIGKSTACRILSGDEYFSDSMPSVTGDSKEARQHLMGKWLVELSELAPARRSDAEDLKAFISGKVDKIRLPYGRRDQTIERQCVFIGTTNEDEFLNDPTGERRWWPVELSARIDLAALKADREQLFAEAVVAYDNREQWWLEPEFEREHAEPVRKLARVSDPWEELILSYVDGPEDDLGGGKPRTEVRAIDVLLNAIGLPEAQHTRATHKRVTDVLKRNGFERHHTRTGKVWRRDL